MRRSFAIALCLPMFAACSMWPLKKPEPVEVPKWQAVQCLDRAQEACAGVPERDYASAEGLALGLGEALRALADCQESHDELRRCVAEHNRKAK